MISRDQVSNIIATAIKAQLGDQPEDERVFTQRLATALEALGLIQFCDIAEPEEASPSLEHVAPDGTSLAASQADVSNWAASRDRSADR